MRVFEKWAEIYLTRSCYSNSMHELQHIKWKILKNNWIRQWTYLVEYTLEWKIFQENIYPSNMYLTINELKEVLIKNIEWTISSLVKEIESKNDRLKNKKLELRNIQKLT